MTGIFCELLSIKKAQTALQNKETTVQSYWKMSDQNTKKIPGIKVAFFNRAGEIMDNFDYLNSSQYFYFVRNPRKKIMAHMRLQLNLSLPALYEPVRF